MKQSTVISMLTFIGFASPAYAYIGPGVGIGTIGIAIAVFAALILLIVGFVWYPLKRILRRRKVTSSQGAGDNS